VSLPDEFHPERQTNVTTPNDQHAHASELIAKLPRRNGTKQFSETTVSRSSSACRSPKEKIRRSKTPRLELHEPALHLSRPAATLSSISNGGEGRGEEAFRFMKNGRVRASTIAG
jgi:hypothetical protein